MVVAIEADGTVRDSFRSANRRSTENFMRVALEFGVGYIRLTIGSTDCYPKRFKTLLELSKKPWAGGEPSNEPYTL